MVSAREWQHATVAWCSAGAARRAASACLPEQDGPPCMADASFPRQLRLLNARHYKAVFDDAPYRVSCPELLFLARPNGLDHPRLGIVVSKKNCRRATQRNRIKRLIRESFRCQQTRLSGIDVIVLARRGAADLDNKAVTELLAKLWNRLLKRAQRPPDESSHHCGTRSPQ